MVWQWYDNDDGSYNNDNNDNDGDNYDGDGDSDDDDGDYDDNDEMYYNYNCDIYIKQCLHHANHVSQFTCKRNGIQLN